MTKDVLAIKGMRRFCLRLARSYRDTARTAIKPDFAHDKLVRADELRFVAASLRKAYVTEGGLHMGFPPNMFR